MRLIDGDELKTAFPASENSTPVLIASVRATINHMPTIEQPEIIRCRDCKCWRELPNGCQGFCDMHSAYPTLTDFCSWAERREVNE